ncbi:plasma-membrane choline transporter-domain-containing protein [Globomyces pollinis-pini]|nr:plasma-membrane choline transporter-domain-containing protein [Globomyces pollinis-pini]
MPNIQLDFPLPPTISDSTNNPQWILPTGHDSDLESNSTDPMFEHLLPTGEDSTSIPSVYVKPEHRPFSDIAFSFLYLVAFLFLVVIGFIEVYTKPTDLSFSKSLFYVFSQIYGTLASLTILSIIGSIIWIYLLSTFSSTIILLTGVCLPISLLLLFLFTFSKLVWGYHAPMSSFEFNALASISLLGFIGGLYTTWITIKNRQLAGTMVKIVELSTDILKANPSMFLLSACLTIAHIIFSVFWLWLFSHIFLHGSLISKDNQITIELQNTGPWVVFFFLVMYFWTSAIFQNIEKVTVSSVVGEWYFDRYDVCITSDQTWWHFKYVSCRSFGTIAIASLLLGIIRCLQFLIRQIERFGSKAFLSHSLVSLIIGLMSDILNNFSSYTLVHVGLTGETYLVSGYQCTRLFRRNLVLGLLTSSISRLMSFMGKLFVSSLIGLSCFWSSVSLLSSGGEWITALVATIIPYYIMGVLTHVIETTVDATFICYLMDLDTNSCHNEDAHRTFSAALK